MRLNLLLGIMVVSVGVLQACGDDTGKNVNPGNIEEGDITDPPPEGDRDTTKPDKPEDPEFVEPPIDPEDVPEDKCKDICENGESRCVDGGIQMCIIVDGCPDWGDVEPCEQCDSNTGECGFNCTNPCSNGEKKCEDNDVWTCVVGEDTCTQWEKSKTCGAEQNCDPKNFECVSGCQDACTENEKRCTDNKMQVCTKGTSGCLVWQDTDACGTGKICNAEGTQCEYACEDDCEPFSIFLLPDTQYYTQAYRKWKTSGKTTADGNIIDEDHSMMVRQTKWIADHKKEMNTRFVLHLGDISNTNDELEWENSVAAMKKLASASIPFALAAGNHDFLYKKDGNLVYFPPRSKSKLGKYYSKDLLKSYFKGTEYENMEWFGDLKYGTNSYSTFSVGNIHFLVLALEYYPRKDVIAWADSILNKAKYSDYHVIVITHGYLKTKGKYTDQRTTPGTHAQAHGMAGKALFDEFIQRHSNIFLVACGHVTDSEYKTHKNLFGKKVHEMLIDYQSESPCQDGLCDAGVCKGSKINSGNGWMRQLLIDPKTGEVTGATHTPVGKDPYSFGSTDPNPHFFCKSRYSTEPTGEDHVNHFTIDVTPIKHEYSDKDIHGFVPRNVNSILSGDQLNPSVAMNRSNGDFVVVWEDDASSDDGTYKDASNKKQNNFDIALRMFKRGGYANGSQKYLTADNSVSKGNQISPDVAMDSKGNFVVVWADDANNDNDYDIRMSGFNSKGELLFSNIMVNESASGNQTLPKVAMASDGRFVVAWNDQQSGKNINIKLRTFHADGKPASGDKYLIDQSEGTRRNPDIAMDDNGNYVVVWDSDSDNNKVYQMMAQKYDFDGNAIGKSLTVNIESTGQQIHGAVGMNAKGAFYVAYRDDRDKDKKYAIRVRGWDENLKEIITDTEVYNETHNNAQPTVCVDDSNNAVLGFYDSNLTHSYEEEGQTYYDDPIVGDVLVATVSSEGNVGTAVSPTELTWKNQKHPSVSCTGDGHVVVVYADDAEDDKSYELYARGFNAIADIK